jgi:hypothetical protein
MKDLAHVVLDHEGFKTLSSVCESDRHFPRSYADWQELVERANGEAVQAGLDPLEPVALDPSEFVEWCSAVQVVPCLDCLRAFAVTRRRSARDLVLKAFQFLGKDASRHEAHVRE